VLVNRQAGFFGKLLAALGKSSLHGRGSSGRAGLLAVVNTEKRPMQNPLRIAILAITVLLLAIGVIALWSSG